MTALEVRPVELEVGRGGQAWAAFVWFDFVLWVRRGLRKSWFCVTLRGPLISPGKWEREMGVLGAI